MKTWKSGFLTAGLLGILTVLSGCQGESTPTAPGGGGGGGGNNPPVNPDVVIEVSNPNPQVLSTTTITATVTIGGQPAPNGTAVEFTTNFGTFTDTGTQTTVRTTLNGQASAVLTSPTPGIARINVRVNNANRQTQVTFGEGGGGGPGAPTITAVTPSTGSPAGGQLVRINGTGFVAPVRVLFGNREAQVVSVTSNQIQVVTPALDLGSTEFQEVTITVFNRAGTTDETSVVASTRFRYELQILTPTVFSVSPFSGPNEGNTRVTIFGQGFQPPTRVFFGAENVEAEVLQITFSQILVMTPPALGMGAGLRNQTVPVRVLNVLTNKEATLGVGYRYGPTMVITAVGPGSADSAVPTSITIYGFGFDDPVAITVGDGATAVALQPIRVSGTEIVARTPALVIQGCGNLSGTIRVTNIEDGSTAVGPSFTFVGRLPRIASITPQPAASGGTITVAVNNPGAGLVRFTIGGQNVVATEISRVGDVATFSVVVPANLVYDTEPCPGGGSRSIMTTFPIVFTNVDTNCTDTLTMAIEPPVAPRILVEPTALTFTSAGIGVPPGPPFTSFAFPSSTQSYTITNTGTATMTIISVTTSPTPPFSSVGPGVLTLAPCESTTVTVTFAPPPSTAAGTFTGTSVVVSNGGTVSVTLTGATTIP